MTDALKQTQLLKEYHSNTPSTYHHIINHLVLTEQYTAASMLVATLQQEQAKPKEAALMHEVSILRSDIRYLQDKLKTSQEEIKLAYMQAEGFRIRMEQLLQEKLEQSPLIDLS